MSISNKNIEIEKYAIIIAILFLCASPIFSPVIRALSLFIVLILAVNRIRFVIPTHFLLLLIFFYILIYATILDMVAISSYGFITASFLYIPISFFGGYIIAKKFTFSEYLSTYEKIIFWLSSVALFFYMLVIFYPSVLKLFFTYNHYGFTSKSIIFLNVLTFEDARFVHRNSGFASEPGLYQYFLNVALWWRLKTSKKIDLHAIIFITSIITTNSTAGLLCMSFILLMGSKRNARVLIALSLLILWPILQQQIQYHITYKLVGSDSFNGRLLPFINAFNYSFTHPFGIGAVQYAETYKSLNIGGWDSFSQLVLRYGYQGLFFILFLLANVIRRDLILGGIIIVALLSQAIWFFPVVSCFYFWSFSSGSKDHAC